MVLILRSSKVALRGFRGDEAAVSAAARAPWGVGRPFHTKAPRRKASKVLRTPKKGHKGRLGGRSRVWGEGCAKEKKAASGPKISGFRTYFPNDG